MGRYRQRPTTSIASNAATTNDKDNDDNDNVNDTSSSDGSAGDSNDDHQEENDNSDDNDDDGESDGDESDDDDSDDENEKTLEQPVEESTTGNHDNNESNVNDSGAAADSNDPKKLDATISAKTTVLLSKSWSIQSAHVPIYTPGSLQKIETFTMNQQLFLLTPSNGDISIIDSPTGTRIGTIRRGIMLNNNNMSTMNNNIDDDDDDDDDSMDIDAITAFGISIQRGIDNNNEDERYDNDDSDDDDKIIVVTCSRNMILRQYLISPTLSTTTTMKDSNDKALDDATKDVDDDEETSDDDVAATPLVSIILQKTWGKCGHTLPVTDVKFHTSNVFCATASIDGTVRIWDVRGGYTTHVYRPMQDDGSSGGGGIRSSVTAMSWYPNEKELMIGIGRTNGSICIHNLRSTNNKNTGGDISDVAVLTDHVSAVTCIEWEVHHNFLITGGRDQVINLWKYSTVADAKHNHKTKKYQNESTSNTMMVIPRYTYTKLKTLPIYEQIEGMVMLPVNDNNPNNNVYLATAGTKGRIRVWEVLTETSGIELLKEQPATSMFGAKRGGYVHLQLVSSSVMASSETKQHQSMLLAADAENNIAFISLPITMNKSLVTSNELTTTRTIVGHNDEILDLNIVPYSHNSISSKNQLPKIVVATNSSQVRIFDMNTFSCCAVLDKHTATCLCVDVSPCGTYIATCGKDKTARVWYITDNNSDKSDRIATTTTAKCVAVAVGHIEAVGSVALSRKASRYSTKGKAAVNGGGSFIVTVSMDRTLKRWNLPGSDVLSAVASSSGNSSNEASSNDSEIQLTAFASARAHEKDINIVTVAPNDSMIATGSQDKTIKLWKANDLTLLATLKGHKRGVWDCQFSLTDRVLATASGDKTVKLWSIASGDYNCVRTFQGHVSSVLRVRFLSAGLQLVSSGADGLIKLWTIRTNESEATMDIHTDKVWAMDISSDGKTLVSGGADSQIVAWKDSTKDVEDAKHAEEEEAILLDQMLANHLRRKEYGEALHISIDRDKPHHTLKALNAIIETSSHSSIGEKTRQQQGMSGVNLALFEIKKYAQAWMSSTDRLLRLLRYCRDWNTKARNCHTAMLTLKAIVTTIPAQTLASTEGVPEILAGIVPYSERHLDRLDRLHESSYLLDFALTAMGVISPHTDEDDDDFHAWEATPKYVLPPRQHDGRVDVGGNVVVGAVPKRNRNESDNESDDVIMVGDSDSDSDEN